MNPRTAFVSTLLVIGLAATGQAEENVTIGELLKSPGSYQLKNIIVHGMVLNAPRYQEEDDPECAARLEVHNFQLVDESGAIEITAVGCRHATLTEGDSIDYGEWVFSKLSNGMKITMRGLVKPIASGFVVELDRVVPSSDLPRVTLPKVQPSR